MSAEIWAAMLAPIVSATFAAGGAYMAVKVELRFIWRELARLEAGVEHIRQEGERSRARIMDRLESRHEVEA